MIEVKECIVCNGKEFFTITKRGHQFSGEVVVECKGCGMVHLSPRMTLPELQKFYSQNQFSKLFRGSAIPDENIMATREQRAQKKIALINPYLDMIPEGSVLEIGCSSGYLLRGIRDKGYEVYGVDPSDGFVQYAKNHYGLTVVSGMFPDAVPNEWGDRFSMIIALHVLEHTDDPIYILKSIRERLKYGGLLILEVPDLNRAVTVRKYLQQNYFQKSHIWDFSGITIKRLLEKCGLKVFVCENYSNNAPDDKNVLVIAGNHNDNLAAIEQTSDNQRGFAKKMYMRLKIKLLAGIFVARLRQVIRTNH